MGIAHIKNDLCFEFTFRDAPQYLLIYYFHVIVNGSRILNTTNAKCDSHESVDTGAE